MLRKKFRDAICPVTPWVYAIVPIKQLDFIVKGLLFVVDSDFDLDVLLSGLAGDGYSDVAHVFGS
jgi:hypothetical protein